MNESTETLEVDGELVARDELLRQLSLGSRPTEVVLSRKETRQKAQYMGNEYFVSLRLSFAILWDLLDQTKPEDQEELIAQIKNHIHESIMSRENYLSGILLHWQMKDQVPSWPRDPKNGAVSAKDIREAWEATQGKP